MNTLIILGSRNPTGQTARAADALKRGLEQQGASTETLFLPAMRIERCRQCDEAGWGICRTEGQCVITDDFASVASRVKQAQAVVFATPVYFSDLSESMRAFTDRLRRTCVQAAGRTGIAQKPALGICVAGGGGGGAPPCCMQLDKALGTCGFDVLDVIPVRRQNLTHKLDALEATGQWLAKSVQ